MQKHKAQQETRNNIKNKKQNAQASSESSTTWHFLHLLCVLRVVPNRLCVLSAFRESTPPASPPLPLTGLSCPSPSLSGGQGRVMISGADPILYDVQGRAHRERNQNYQQNASHPRETTMQETKNETTSKMPSIQEIQKHK